MKKPLIYYTKDQGHKKSRYTVVGQYENDQLKLAYSKRSYPDNFSKAAGKGIAQHRLTNNITKYCKIIDSTSDKNIQTFVNEAKNYIFQLKNPKNNS